MQTLTHTVDSIKDGTLCAQDVTLAHMQAIREHNPRLNALCCLNSDAQAQATALDNTTNPKGMLHGATLVVKDLFHMAGLPTQAGSALLQDTPPATEDAPLIKRLRAHGAVILGKSNLDAMAAHICGATSCNGPVYNPWQLERGHSPGGSSAGTASAVAAGLCSAGIGTDTGGSVRVPAGWCGVCGLRPTQGVTDLRGCLPRSATLDTAGPIARTVADVALLFRAMTTEPETESPPLVPPMQTPLPVRPRIGVPMPFARDGMDDDVLAGLEQALDVWLTAGTEVVDVPLPLASDPAVSQAINTIRAYDYADHYWRLFENTADVARERPHILAEYTMGKTLPEATYRQALAFREETAQRGAEAFDGVDVLCLPVAPMSAPLLSTPWEAFARARRLSDFGSLLGFPTLVVPVCVSPNGLPLGMQLIGLPHQEEKLFALGALFEKARGPFARP